MSVATVTYYDLEAAKANLGEEGQTPNEERLNNWGYWVDNKINDELRYIFPPFSDNLRESDFTANGFTKVDYVSLRTLATAGLEAKFWKETNGQEETLKKWEEELERWIKRLTTVEFMAEN